MAGTATYRKLTPIVGLGRMIQPSCPANADISSGRWRWFSICRASFSESARTTPSARTQVSRTAARLAKSSNDLDDLAGRHLGQHVTLLNQIQPERIDVGALRHPRDQEIDGGQRHHQDRQDGDNQLDENFGSQKLSLNASAAKPVPA